MPARPLLAVVLGLAVALSATAQNKKADDKKSDEKDRKGTVTGVVIAKGDPAKNENWIEVKADGEEKGRRYVPHWKGGAPAAGGGPDKAMIAELKKVNVKDRVRLEWVFEERPRVEKIEVLKGEGKKEK